MIDPTAVELCARQVASTSGDLRLAIKACRAALEALTAARAAHFAAAAAAAADGCGKPPAAVAGKGPAACVGVRDMMAALGRLAGVRSSQHGAATVASIRTLPNQQQLLLYSLSVLCTPPELPEVAAGPSGLTGFGSGSFSTPPTASRSRSAASLWAEVTPSGSHAPRAVLVRTPSGSAAGSVGRRLFGAGGGKGGKGGGGAGKGGKGAGAGAGATVLAVGFEDAYAQYCKVCRLVGMGAAARPELRHMADLLAQSALLDVIEGAAAGGGGASGSGVGTPGGAKASATPGRRGAAKRGPRGFGGAAGASPAAGGGAAGLEGVQLTLRVGQDEVQRALAANPALRRLVDDA